MTIQDVMRRVLALGGLLVLAIVVLGGVAGFLVADWTGVVSALVGAAVAILLVALTAVAVLVGHAASRAGVLGTTFVAVVVAGMLVQLVAFLVLVLVLALRDQAWLADGVVFATLLAAVLGTLLIDVLVLVRSRRPAVDEPADEETLGRPARR